MKTHKFQNKWTTMSLLIIVGSLWLWKLAEYEYRTNRPTDLLSQGPWRWGYIIDLTIPCFATLGAGLVLVGLRFSGIIREKRPKKNTDL